MTTSTTKLFPRYTGPDISVIKLTDKKQDASPAVNPSKWYQDKPTFWLDRPSALVETYDLLPQDNMTDGERLNAMTRVVIIIAAIMFLIQFELWWLFLVVGLIVIIALWQLNKEHILRASFQREYLRRPIIVKPINPIIRPLTQDSPPLNIIARI